MLTEHDSYPPMYKAELSGNELVVAEVGPHVYMRFGTQGLSATRFEACEALKGRIMAQFVSDCKCIDWQAQRYIRRLH